MAAVAARTTERTKFLMIIFYYYLISELNYCYFELQLMILTRCIAVHSINSEWTPLSCFFGFFVGAFHFSHLPLSTSTSCVNFVEANPCTWASHGSLPMYKRDNQAITHGIFPPNHVSDQLAKTSKAKHAASMSSNCCCVRCGARFIGNPIIFSQHCCKVVGRLYPAGNIVLYLNQFH